MQNRFQTISRRERRRLVSRHDLLHWLEDFRGLKSRKICKKTQQSKFSYSKEIQHRTGQTISRVVLRQLIEIIRIISLNEKLGVDFESKTNRFPTGIATILRGINSRCCFTEKFIDLIRIKSSNVNSMFMCPSIVTLMNTGRPKQVTSEACSQSTVIVG